MGIINASKIYVEKVEGKKKTIEESKRRCGNKPHINKKTFNNS